MRDRFGLGVWASAETARALETGDEEAISLAAAKRAGVYPAELAFHSCPVERKLADGEEWAFGEAQFQALHTPGHSRDMLSYLVRAGGRLLLFPGDTVFHGGKVLISDTHDCDVHAYAQSLRRLAEHPIDALFPGHMLWVARGARSHTAAALEYVRRLLLPPNVL
jgi:glyoxylase-like metal-dependent hydrolase (beta-lactamase superfamily II)